MTKATTLLLYAVNVRSLNSRALCLIFALYRGFSATVELCVMKICGPSRRMILIRLYQDQSWFFFGNAASPTELSDYGTDAPLGVHSAGSKNLAPPVGNRALASGGASAHLENGGRLIKPRVSKA